MFYRHFVNGKVPFFKVIAMANIIVGANIQMNGTGQAVHQMQNLAHGINVEFNRVSQSIHNVNNTFNRFENNITRINNHTTQTFR